jgi:hypothetical protein
MNIVIKEDRIWEQVLELLSQGGNLSRLYKLPHHELMAVVKAHGQKSSRDLARVFNYVQKNDQEGLKHFLVVAGESRVFSMLHCLIRCMRCWVESESSVQSLKKRWRVAHA